jgi:hypothetical protein
MTHIVRAEDSGVKRMDGLESPHPAPSSQHRMARRSPAENRSASRILAFLLRRSCPQARILARVTRYLPESVAVVIISGDMVRPVVLLIEELARRSVFGGNSADPLCIARDLT